MAEENSSLRDSIALLNREISALETENEVLSEQLAFFRENAGTLTARTPVAARKSFPVPQLTVAMGGF
jgi:hypothetical protein